jgi:hypothetical protein
MQVVAVAVKTLGNLVLLAQVALVVVVLAVTVPLGQTGQQT